MKLANPSTRRKSSVGNSMHQKRKSSVSSAIGKEIEKDTKKGIEASPVGEIDDKGKTKEASKDDSAAKGSSIKNSTGNSETEIEKDKEKEIIEV